jgi:hypothetical protein
LKSIPKQLYYNITRPLPNRAPVTFRHHIQQSTCGRNPDRRPQTKANKPPPLTQPARAAPAARRNRQLQTEASEEQEKEEEEKEEGDLDDVGDGSSDEGSDDAQDPKATLTRTKALEAHSSSSSSSSSGSAPVHTSGCVRVKVRLCSRYVRSTPAAEVLPTVYQTGLNYAGRGASPCAECGVRHSRKGRFCGQACRAKGSNVHRTPVAVVGVDGFVERVCRSQADAAKYLEVWSAEEEEDEKEHVLIVSLPSLILAAARVGISFLTSVCVRGRCTSRP